METPIFSIIIPVYNGEKYIEFCLNSIISQTLKDWELILINDGSTDKTSELLNKYINKNIYLISKSNEGVSIARNKGLDIAKGEYILFVDADDILYPNALSTLYDSQKKMKVDYLRYEYQTIDVNGNLLYPNYEAKERKKVSNRALEAAECITRVVRNEYFLWAGVFRKAIIDQYHLRFMESCTYNEDTLFMIMFFMHSKNHVYISKTLYGYRKFDGAVTARFTEKNYQDVKKVVEIICNIYNSCEDAKMQIAIKSVIETLYLRIIEIAYKRHETAPMIRFCCQHPIQNEWKIIKLFGYSIARNYIPLIHYSKKIIRKFR